MKHKHWSDGRGDGDYCLMTAREMTFTPEQVPQRFHAVFLSHFGVEDWCEEIEFDVAYDAEEDGTVSFPTVIEFGEGLMSSTLATDDFCIWMADEIETAHDESLTIECGEHWLEIGQHGDTDRDAD